MKRPKQREIVKSVTKNSKKSTNHVSIKEEVRSSLQANGKALRPKPRPVGIRRPLRIHHERKNLRHHAQQSRKRATAVSQLQGVLSRASRSFTGADIHPIAMNAWLASDEPLHADLLRDCLITHLAELDSLVDRFNNTSLSDFSLLSNPLIHVPKGLGMQLVCYSQDYGALITQAQRREGAFLHMGLRGNDGSRNERRYGFDPAEVLERYALSLPPMSVMAHSTLNNEVHLLLQPQRFHGCPSHIYNQLLPGLRLATKLLLHRSTAHFWHTVAFGSRVLDEKLTSTNRYRCFRLLDKERYSLENAGRFEAFLASLTKTLHFHFSLWPLPKREGLYAGMAIVPDYKRGESFVGLSTGAEYQRNCRICLHTDFYTTAQRLAKLSNPDPSLVLRFNFFVAITVCHELAHFVEMNSPHEGAENMRETYWGQNSWAAEMGSAFEEAVFGGKVHPVGAKVDCAWGCTVYDNPNSVQRGRISTDKGKTTSLSSDTTAEPNKEKHAIGVESLGLLCDLTKFFTVPMEYIAKLQQRETWDAGSFDEDDLDAGKSLIIPRDGAQAFSIPVFDMVMWDDEATNAVSDGHGDPKTPWRRLRDGSLVKAELSKPQRSKSKDVSMADWNIDKDLSLTDTMNEMRPRSVL